MYSFITGFQGPTTQRYSVDMTGKQKIVTLEMN